MSVIKTKGYIKAKIKYKNSDRVDYLEFNNQTLNGGKQYLTNAIIENSKKLYIANMLFGDGGGESKEVPPTQDKLLGVVRLKKPVIAQIDPDNPMQAIFSIEIKEEECNDCTLNEMGLEMNDETLFCLATFSDLNKTDQMEISWSWCICSI